MNDLKYNEADMQDAMDEIERLRKMTNIIESKPTLEIMEWTGKVHLEEAIKEIGQLREVLKEAYQKLSDGLDDAAYLTLRAEVYKTTKQQ